MLVERSRNCDLGTVYASEIFIVHIVHEVISAVLQTAQLNRPTPMAGEECIVYALAFADNVSLRAVKPYVVKISEILASREHFVFVNVQPLLKDLLSLRCQVRLAVLFDEIR